MGFKDSDITRNRRTVFQEDYREKVKMSNLGKSIGCFVYTLFIIGVVVGIVLTLLIGQCTKRYTVNIHKVQVEEKGRTP